MIIFYKIIMNNKLEELLIKHKQIKIHIISKYNHNHNNIQKELKELLIISDEIYNIISIHYKHKQIKNFDINNDIKILLEQNKLIF